MSDQASWLSLLREDQHARVSFSSKAEGAESWTPLSFELEERLDATFTCRVTLSASDPTADPRAFRERAVTVNVERGDSVRAISGFVARIELQQAVDGERGAVVELTVVPALAMLARNRRSRIFQDMSAPDILKQVLEEELEPYDREVRFDLQGTYSPHEVCFQYDESDFEFLTWLMAKEGIFYFFEANPDDGREVLVIADTQTSFPVYDEGAAISYSAHGSGTGLTEAVRQLVATSQVAANRVTVWDADWTRPKTEFKREQELPSPEGFVPPPSEQYVHSPRVRFSGYAEPQYSGDDIDKQTQLHVERLRARVDGASGRTDVTGLMPGMVFELAGHPDPALNRCWLVTAATHEGANPATVGVGERDNQEEYANQITVIPADVAHRPQEKARACRVPSTMTATVTGPAGEEIHTDVHGRVKAQFHWDRDGEHDERSSCWLRVMGPMSGMGFGTLFTPRIGMEVVVGFHYDDINRPFVAGTLYNGDNRPPLDLPKDKTRSTIRTSTSPGGEGFNEIRFEDAKGAEELFIHAQKDMNEKVKNCHSMNVGANQTLSVGGSRTATVGGDETIAVKGNQTITIGGKEGGELSLKAKKSVTYEAVEFIKWVVGETYIEITPDAITLQQKDGQKVSLDPESLSLLSKQKTKMKLDGDAQLDASTGASMKLTSDIEASAKGGANVKLDSDVSAAAQMGAKLTLNQDAQMKGMNALVQGDVEAGLKGAAGTVTAGPAGSDVKGPMVNVTGDAMTNVSGAMVKLN